MLSKILRGIAAVVIFFAFPIGMYYLQHTEVEPWVPVGAAALPAAAAMLLPRGLRRRLTGVRNAVASAAIVFVAVGALCFSGILALNYEAADNAAEKVRAEIVNKSVRTEYGTRRVGRGRYVRDTSRKIYHYEYTLRLPDGMTLKKSTDAAGYVRLRTGRHETVELRRGYLGWTVLN